MKTKHKHFLLSICGSFAVVSIALWLALPPGEAETESHTTAPQDSPVLQSPPEESEHPEPGEPEIVKTPEDPPEPIRTEFDTPLIMRGFHVGMTLDEAIQAEKRYDGNEPGRSEKLDDGRDLVAWDIPFRNSRWEMRVISGDNQIQAILLVKDFAVWQSKVADVEFFRIVLALTDKYGDPDIMEAAIESIDGRNKYLWDTSDKNPWEIRLIEYPGSARAGDGPYIRVAYTTPKLLDESKEPEDKKDDF